MSAWNDSRIEYPYDKIQVTPNLYVLDTRLSTERQLKALLYNVRNEKLKNQYEMMSYLLMFEPNSWMITEKATKKTLYTCALENFVLSNHHDKILLSENKDTMQEIAEKMYEHIKETRDACRDGLESLKDLLR